MKKARKKRQPGKTRPLKPRLLALGFLLTALPAAAVFGAHHFGDAATKLTIERHTVGTVNLLREQEAVPQEVRLWLDLLVDLLPTWRGPGVLTGRDAAAHDHLPPGGGPVSTQKLIPLHNRGYSVGYDPATRLPAWVAYKMPTPAAQNSKPLAPRENAFTPDNRVHDPVTPEAYVNSNYDRGHLAPDRAIGRGHGEEARRETYRMTNIAPQSHRLNAGPWKQLETRIAERYPARFGDVWVVCGPIYEPGKPRRTLKQDVPVPDAFFMIVTQRDAKSGEIRTQAHRLEQEPTLDDLSERLVSIDSIEKETGLNFFPKLPDDDQATLEARPAPATW